MSVWSGHCCLDFKIFFLQKVRHLDAQLWCWALSHLSDQGIVTTFVTKHPSTRLSFSCVTDPRQHRGEFLCLKNNKKSKNNEQFITPIVSRRLLQVIWASLFPVLNAVLQIQGGFFFPWYLLQSVCCNNWISVPVFSVFVRLSGLGSFRQQSEIRYLREIKPATCCHHLLKRRF